MGRLVLAAFTYTGAGSPTLGKRAEQTEFFRTHNRRPRGRDILAACGQLKTESERKRTAA